MMGTYLLIASTVVVWAMAVYFVMRARRIFRRSEEAQKRALDKRIAGRMKVQEACVAMQKDFDTTVALYDTTKTLSRSLDPETVVQLFREETSKYLNLGDCRFLRHEEALKDYPGYTRVVVHLQRHRVGYLIADGVKPDDEGTFQVMVHQFQLAIKRAFLYQQIQELAITDSLTGVFSRRHCLSRLAEELRYAGKFNAGFSFLMIDVDHFKQLNDTYGHLVGDAILREIAHTISDCLREIDLVGRYGGEEFCVIMPYTTSKGALRAAERIRQQVAGKTFRLYDETLHSTLSIGITVAEPADHYSGEHIVEQADCALYQAKAAGRNKVCLFKRTNDT